MNLDVLVADGLIARIRADGSPIGTAAALVLVTAIALSPTATSFPIDVGGLSMYAFTSRTGYAKSYVQQALDHLEKIGAVVRLEHSADEYVTLKEVLNGNVALLDGAW